MKIDTSHSEPIGIQIINEPHKLFHELACEMRRATIRIKQKI